MRRTLLITILLMIATFSSIPITSATAPSGNSEEIISSSTTWDEDGTLNGTLLVESGSSLTINSNVSVVTGSSITVEEGATLNLNGDLVGAELDSLLRLQSDSSLMFNLGDVAESGTMRLQFDHQIMADAQFDITVGGFTIDAGEQEFVDFTVPLNGSDIIVEFSTFYSVITHIESVSFAHSGDTVVNYSPQDISYERASLFWISSSFSIDILGSFTMDSATLDGADLNCVGQCSITGSQLTGSAPINIQTDGTLTITDSNIAGSRTDEDIIAHDTAGLTYTSSTGTGGDTDAWIRLLSERIIQTNGEGIKVDQTGIGYANYTRYDETNETGIVSIGSSEFSRIVEWMDGEGQVHAETGELTFTVTSGWGTFITTVAAPHTAYAEVNVSLPYISIDDIDMEDNFANVNESIGFMLTVSNKGNSEATANIRCYVDGEDVDTAPSTITVTLLPGEESETPVSWYSYEDGLKIITCKALIPNILESFTDQITNVEGASSQEVSWTYKDEVADAPLLIYGTVVAAILAGLWLFTRNNTYYETELEEEKQYTEEIEEIATESDED
ncbi:MAG: hypothetical protein P8Q55_04145 [Candidatus Poseidoniaceae archaeon]|nr:hypothetical protein [Candidatus Poseidoniaceae archaeon]